MSVWSAVILLLFGAFIHGSFALRCYKCSTPAGGGGACDDPFNDTALQPATCEFGLDLCLKFEGTWKQPGMNTVYALHRINVHSGIKSIQYRAV